MRLPFQRTQTGLDRHVITIEDRTRRGGSGIGGSDSEGDYDESDDASSSSSDPELGRSTAAARRRRRQRRFEQAARKGASVTTASSPPDLRNSADSRRIDQILGVPPPAQLPGNGATVKHTRTASNTPIPPAAGSREGSVIATGADSSGAAGTSPSETERRTARRKLRDGPDVVVDILYENQRGNFLCGAPLFSSNTLWFTDPHAWTHANMEYSPVNIFNATVPDPTWEWSWPQWFVDMSGDKDENGWEYSILFSSRSWHGHHVWYHSFVRRRRWLRKRRRKPLKTSHTSRADDHATTFSASLRGPPTGPQSINSGLRGEAAAEERRRNGLDNEDEDDVDNIAALLQRLKRARLDREKLTLVKNYLDHGTDLAALPDSTPQVVNFLVYGRSRAQLVSLLRERAALLTTTLNSNGDTPDTRAYLTEAADLTDAIVLEYNHPWASASAKSNHESSTGPAAAQTDTEDDEETPETPATSAEPSSDNSAALS
ncbi:hypothetical protein PYCC9005_004515 [Savitreella phatthalungensis]